MKAYLWHIIIFYSLYYLQISETCRSPYADIVADIAAVVVGADIVADIAGVDIAAVVVGADIVAHPSYCPVARVYYRPNFAYYRHYFACY